MCGITIILNAYMYMYMLFTYIPNFMEDKLIFFWVANLNFLSSSFSHLKKKKWDYKFHLLSKKKQERGIFFRPFEILFDCCHINSIFVAVTCTCIFNNENVTGHNYLYSYQNHIVPFFITMLPCMRPVIIIA